MHVRKECDLIGCVDIPKSALYGIHAFRATKNFPNNQNFSKDWYKALGYVKKACYLTYKSYISALKRKGYSLEKLGIRVIDSHVLQAIIDAANEIIEGEWYSHFIVPAMQGGAGTSINMNVNEIIANRALEMLGYEHGRYDIVHPIDHANIYQSTNDVVPTALKIAIMYKLQTLEKEINNLRKETEKKEQEFGDIPRIAYTQLQYAVPTTYGRLFANYSDALSRDWWRVSKAWERIKQVNLGGSAIGTSLTVPSFFVMEVVSCLRDLTGLPVARSENMQDNTSNYDSIAEVHAILKVNAVTLKKIADDLRLISADVSNKEINIPAVQTGSSIMPSKVNPVISEYVISVSEKVFSNDVLVTSLSSMSNLDLNAYLPLIGHTVLESIDLLISACNTLCKNMINGVKVEKEKAIKNYFSNPALATVLVPFIGYEKAGKVAKEMKDHNIDIFEANKKLGVVSEKKLKEVVSPSFVLKTGFSVKDFDL